MRFHMVPPFANPIVAVGAENKLNVALWRDQELEFARFEGRLEEASLFQEFRSFVLTCEDAHFLIDAHPLYITSRVVRENVPMDRYTEIWHHLAHAVIPVYEFQREASLIAVYDGTGFGMDQNIWGGEFFYWDGEDFIRVAHLEPFPLVGGDRAVSQPYRLLVSYFFETDEPQWKNELLPILSRYTDDRTLESLRNIVLHQQRRIWTSSMGRLFDIIAVICGFPERDIQFEGEPAVYLTRLAEEYAGARLEGYPYEILEYEKRLMISFRSTVESALRDRLRGEEEKKIAHRFHRTVIQATEETFERLSEKWGTEKWGLSGGVFQNSILRKELTKRAHLSSELPCTDLSLSIGQLLYYAFREKRDVSFDYCED